MLNFALFLLGSSFSHFGLHLFRNTMRACMYLTADSFFGLGVGYSLDTMTRILFYPVVGWIIDKFKRKYFFVFVDLTQFFYFLGVFIYLMNFDMGIVGFFVIIFICSILDAFSFLVNKTIVPEIFSGDNLLRAISFEISVERISRVLSIFFIFIIFIGKIRLEIAVLLSSILLFASSFIKNFIIMQDIELGQNGVISSISSVIKSIFLKKNMRKAVISFCFIDMFSGVLLASVIPLILKISHKGSSPELLSYIDAISAFDTRNFGLILETLVWMLYVLSPLILLIFLQMLEGISIGRALSIVEKRLFKYLYAPISFSCSMWFFYGAFFKRDGFYRSALFSLKTETVYGSLNMFLMLATVVGVFIALTFFQLFPWKYNPKKGMRLALYLLVPLSFLISCIVIYFGILGRGDVIQLTFALTPSIIFLTIAVVAYNIFFTSFYQNQFPIRDLGKCSSLFASLTTLFRIIGMLLYKVLINKYALLSTPIIFFLFTIWNVFSFRNFEKD